MSKIVSGAKDIGGGILSGIGLSGGAKEAAKYNADPTAYSELYDKALGQIQGVGTDQASMGQRDSINNALQGQLDGLENNAAGRKANFLEDSARGFAADSQNLARAKGGTGTLAQASRMSGSMYDSQARANSRGLNDLYSQATQDLGQLQGVQGNLYSQDMGKATQTANVYQNELASRRGTNANNLDNSWNAQQAQYGRMNQTIGAAAKAAAAGGGG